MNRLERLLDGVRAPGLYRWESLVLPGTARAAVERHGWRCYVVHGERAATKAELIDEVARAASFPRPSGRNWDALADRLRDLSWAPAIGYVVLWDKVNRLADPHRDDYDTAVEVLADSCGWWRTHGVPFSVLLRGAPPGLPQL
ncbi:MAG TPA: barstar family protein [Acidimicrobiales bacterium]